MNTVSNAKLRVFFDGLCPLCRREIDFYRRQDKSQVLELIDIAQPDFDAKKEGLDPVTVHQRFHVKNEQGQIFEGVPAFQQIWRSLGIFSWLDQLASSQLGRPLFNFGYKVFAKIRPYLRNDSCDTGYCVQKQI
jgi:predicted DCC family thiol-disulfide oxidoreductase YuxK